MSAASLELLDRLVAFPTVSSASNRDLVAFVVDFLAARGIDIVSWFPGINGDGLEHIGVVGLTAAKKRVLDRMFGASRIVLQDLSRSQAPGPTANRVDDYAPWNGGDNITSNHYGCTSGAGITYKGVQYMITAAHCYEPGWSVYNEFVGVSRPDLTREGAI